MYEREGVEALDQHRLPLLSYKEAQALKAEHQQPAIEAAAPGEGLADNLLPQAMDCESCCSWIWKTLR